MKKNKPTNKGITLIALVITIIVLLILAGVSIAMLTGNNGILNQANDAKIMTNLSKVDEAIKLYKSNLKIEKVVDEGNSGEVTNDDLINDATLKEYVIEETLRPIAVVEGYDKLGIKDKFGEGYKNISSYEIAGESTPYIGTLNELNNVCAIDLIDGTLYYIENGKVWSIEGKTEIANNYERVNAEEGEWTFNAKAKILTAYNGDLTQVRGEQQVREVIIPNYYEGTRVSAIGESVFKNNTDLTKLTISKGIQVIGRNAFYHCYNLTGNLIIPDGVTEVGENAFSECGQLTGNLNIPDSVTIIGRAAFRTCSSLEGKLKLGKNVQTIQGEAFQNCGALTGDLIIPDSVTIIGSTAFYGCSSLDGIINIGNKIVSIGGGAFGKCTNLKGDLIIPDSVTSIGDSAFSDCSSLNGTLKLSENLDTIEDYTFFHCYNLTGNLIIPNSVITINRGAFAECTNLVGDLLIPNSVTSIGISSFRGCSSLKTINFLNSSVKIADDATTIASNIKIIGHKNSTAEEYATKYNRTFEEIR